MISKFSLEMQFWNFEKHLYGGLLTNGDEYVYASVPNGFFLNENILRIYFSKRDKKNASQPYFLDYDLEQKKIVFIDSDPLIPLGNIGAFDDSGIMPSCVVEFKNQVYLYYIGWNLGITVPFRNSVGIAISKDRGLTFKKLYEGPILDRTKREPYFVASSCVLIEGEKWKLWYLSCVKWKIVNGKKQHYYHIKYAESNNGIDWERNGVIAIDFKDDLEYAISVPRIIKENGIYKMWYSFRGSKEFENYTIGYAESKNGIDWIRMDNRMKFTRSGNNWDTEMICYPFVFDYKNERYMLYNGNGYGKTGFGIAKLQDKG